MQGQDYPPQAVPHAPSGGASSVMTHSYAPSPYPLQQHPGSQVMPGLPNFAAMGMSHLLILAGSFELQWGSAGSSALSKQMALGTGSLIPSAWHAMPCAQAVDCIQVAFSCSCQALQLAAQLNPKP